MKEFDNNEEIDFNLKGYCFKCRTNQLTADFNIMEYGIWERNSICESCFNNIKHILPHFNQYENYICDNCHKLKHPTYEYYTQFGEDNRTEYCFCEECGNVLEIEFEKCFNQSIDLLDQTIDNNEDDVIEIRFGNISYEFVDIDDCIYSLENLYDKFISEIGGFPISNKY